MMKYFLILALFPLIFADISEEEFVEKLNERRRELAKRENIPNMNEMRWSNYLVTITGKAEKWMSDQKKTKRDTFIPRPPPPVEQTNYSEEYDALIKIVSYDDAIGKLDTILPKIRRNSSYLANDVVFLQPRFSGIGCMVTVGAELKCFMSMRWISNELFEKEGEAGSKCGYDYENSDGLCRYQSIVFEGKSTVEMPETTPKPIENEKKKGKSTFDYNDYIETNSG